MNDPFITYDTLTIGSELDGQAHADPIPSEKPKLPSILARLPRIPLDPPRPKVRQRFDDPEPAIPMAHLAEEDPVAASEAASPSWQPALGDPTATIRIDTITPAVFDTPAAEPQREPATPPSASMPATPATIPFVQPAEFAPPPAEEHEALDDEWTTWLLNLEATIQPYSRWIALAAVIAALGLTVVLLRGGGAPLDATETAPQVSTEATNQVLAGEPTWEQDPAEVEAAPWLTPQPPTTEPTADLGPLRQPPTAAVAVGPVSAPTPPGRATLTGEVFPSETPRVADSTAADPFTRTQR